ncbi:MAG TPA: EFR1 family ferrodoxin [Bacteroidales bacterium]|nr:EFR1 family ferrodoxin [Bacteroidales bacterium]
MNEEPAFLKNYMKSQYDNLLMIYYSGTGNSKRVSEWIVETAAEAGVRTCITSFRDFSPEMVAGFTGKTLIGFFSATHGFNMPHSMLRFLFRFKELRGSDVFIGNTRAGMKLSKLFMPGLSGLAMYFPALIMLFKGYKVRSMYPVDLPSNWISLHPGLKPKVIDSMFGHYHTLTQRFAEKVLSGKRVFLKSFVLLPLDLLVAPIAVGYYLVGRFIIAKTFITNENCDNCGLCIKQCPTQSIVLSGNRPYWKLTCESCMKCMNYCPKRAIETAHSFFFILLIALILFVNPFLSEKVMLFVTKYMRGSGFAYELLYFIVQWLVAIPIYVAGYKLMHYLAKYPFVNRLIKYTSFTYWKFWRRYKAPKELKIGN